MNTASKKLKRQHWHCEECGLSGSVGYLDHEAVPFVRSRINAHHRSLIAATGEKRHDDSRIRVQTPA